MGDSKSMSNTEELSFPSERIEAIILKRVETTIESDPYDEAIIQHWIAKITEEIMADLVELSKLFKFVVNVIIMEKNGAGLNTANSAYWDSLRDGCIVVPWPAVATKNPTLSCITTVYGMAI